MGEWKLKGRDKFTGKFYDIFDSYPNEQSAIEMARERRADFGLTQPSSGSQGRKGVQDKVYIVRPDGTQYLFDGSNWVNCVPTPGKE